MKVQIILEVDENDPSADPDHEMGITNDAYDRLTSFTEDGPPPLSWLGEVQEVERLVT